MANEIALNFSESLTNRLVDVEEALPRDFNKSRFVQNCLTVLNEKPELARVNQAQLQLGLLKGAFLGLDFMNKECYLIPYGNTVQFQTSYMGECKFIKKYSIRPIKDITSYVVRDGDEFRADIIENEHKITFKPKPFNNSEIVGVFAVVYFKDGGILYETMSKKEVDDVRNSYSKMKNSKAWQNSWSEMARKTVLRRLTKHIECDFESAEAIKAWDDGSDSTFEVKAPRPTNEVVDAFGSSDNQAADIIDGEVVSEE